MPGIETGRVGRQHVANLSGCSDSMCPVPRPSVRSLDSAGFLGLCRLLRFLDTPEQFKKIDTNSDGFIELKEAKAASTIFAQEKDQKKETDRE